MRILKIWLISLNGQQLFFKEYENVEDNIVSNMLNTGVIHSFINFFNTHLVQRYCDFILFDDILFTFHYMLNAPVAFTTLVVTRIDKKIAFETQSKVLRKVAESISIEFTECYKEVMVEEQCNISLFEPFGLRCDSLLQKFASDSAAVPINGF
jgi:hypothetical protein